MEKLQGVFTFISILVVLVKNGCCENVSGFEVAIGGTNLVKLEHNGTVTINLVYETGGTGLNFAASIDTGHTFNTSSAVKNESARTITYTIDSTQLSVVGFGVYLITFTLTPQSGSAASKNMVIFYQEPIIGFAINRYEYLPLNEPVYFDVSFASGSNIETEWFLDTNETYLLKHSGKPRNLQLNFTFTVPGQHNVTTVAANSVTRLFDSMLVTAYYRINGLNISKSDIPTSTSEQALFYIHLSPLANTDIGTLKVNLTYGDSTEETVSLSSVLSSMQSTNGYQLTHQYSTQGNYTMDAIFYTEIDVQNFTLDFYIWDPLSVTISSTHAIASVNQTITFSFLNTPTNGFRYNLDFGDGNKVSNNDSAWYSAYVSETLSHVYTADGTFNVTFTAWNSFYASSNNVIIIVQHPIPADSSMLLSVNNDTIPIPNGIMMLTLRMTEYFPTPTDAYCQIDYGDVNGANESTVIDYAIPVVKYFTYNSSGPRSLSVDCSNMVSSLRKTYDINVYFLLNGFNVTTATGTVPSDQDVKIALSLSITANLSMGTLNVNLTYGDNTDETLNLDNQISQMQSSGGYEVYHTYLSQGSYICNVTIYSQIDAITFTLNVYVWDVINVTLNSTLTAKVNEAVSFKFLHPPVSGFQYIIDYGDGNTVDNDNSVWYSSYVDQTLSHTYIYHGIYVVTISAWNLYYSKNSTYSITIEHPIPASDITLSPLSDIIPLPDGVVEFTLLMEQNNPTPTNVTCNYDYDEGNALNESTVFSYNVPITKSINYTISSNKSVTFECWNLVSRMTKTAEIAVLNFTLDDFEITFPTPFAMNTTVSSEVDTNFNFPNGYRVFKTQNVSRTILFTVDLRGCSRMPPDIEFTWKFGDKTPDVTQAVSDQLEHDYAERGNYTIEVIIKNTKTSKSTTKQLSLTMGIAQISVSPTEGVINKTAFTFTFSGGTNYVFNTHSAHNTMISSIGNKRTLKYSQWGVYHEYVIVDHGDVTEIVHIPEPVKVDFNITGGLSVSLSNDTIALPPGNVSIIVSIIDPQTKPFVNCTINLKDPINKDITSNSTNITYDEPFEIVKYYKSLGEYDMEVNCSNLVSSENTTFSVDVSNSCFERGEIFDRKYADSSTPMRVLTSVDTTISNRMQVLCSNVEFLWTLTRVANTSDVMQYTGGGTYKLGKGAIPEGLVTLNLRLATRDPPTQLEETMYVRLVKLPPIAFIIGGNKRSARFKDGIARLDALTGSYDSEKGYNGDKHHLEFHWLCYKVSGSSLEAIEVIYKNNDFQNMTCNLTDTEIAGQMDLNLTLGREDQGYIIIVTVIDNDKNSTFTQLIKTIPGDPPDVSISCTLNCLEKVAVTLPLNLVTECRNCDRPVEYRWSLTIFDVGTDSWSNVNDFASKSITGLNREAMIIQANSLESGRVYALKLEARFVGGNYTTQIVDLRTNFPPYNGTCFTTDEDTIYEAPLDMVNVKCEGWADEGEADERNYDEDLEKDEPLTYLFATRTKRLDKNGAEISVNAELTKGGESSAINLPIQVGDENFNYTVEMQVLVSDRFGDSSEYSFEIQVKPNTGLASGGAVGEVFDEFDKVVTRTKNGGNDMAVVRLLGSMASVINTPSGGSESNVTDVFKNKTKDLSNTLTQTVTNTTVDQMSASDAQQVTRNVEAMVNNPDFVSDDVALNSATIVDKLIGKVKDISQTVPFPVEQLRSMEGAAGGTMSTVDKVLGSLMPTTLVDVNAVFTVDSIYQDLVSEARQNNTDLIGTGNYTDGDIAINETSLMQKAQAEYITRTQEVAIMREKAASANSSVPRLMSSLNTTFDVKLKMTEVGANRSEIIGNSVQMGVVKMTSESLTNYQPLGGVNLDFEFDPNDTEVGVVEIKQATFEKPPFIAGGGVASLTSKAVQVDVSSSRVVPKIKLPNQEVPAAAPSRPLTSHGDPEGMFYRKFEVKNDADVALVYLKPDGYDPVYSNLESLYWMYIQKDTFPTSTSYIFKKLYSIRDWENYGFKLMSTTLTKGKHYIGIKPQPVPKLSKKRRRRRRSVGSVTTDVSVTVSTDSSTEDSTDSTVSETTTVSQNNASFDVIQANFTLIIFTTGCRSWDNSRQEWSPDGCTVLPFSDLNNTVCRCPEAVGNVFAATFYVPPNTIDFSSVFSKFDPSNASIYGTCIAVIVIWIFAVVFLRRKDKKDIEEWATYFLSDSDVTDSYFFLITVETGMRRSAGTKSKVNFVLVGEDEDSGVRLLDDGIREGFPTGTVRKFVMGTRRPLGDLTYLNIWHDNSGEDSERSWYLNQITVDDPHTNQRYVFLCDQWLAVEEDDGKTDRVIPVSGKENLSRFNTLFFQHAQFNITENHLWLSLLMRPNQSSFTRVQRASCILAMLFLTMIANAMFFRSSDEDTSTDTITLGMLKFSTSIVFISFIGIIITTPPIIIITMIFKKTKPKPLKPRPLSWYTRSSSEETSRFDCNEFFYTDHLPFPYKTIYVAWVIIFLAVASSSFFLLLYSMQWGHAKSEEWLSSFIFSFVQSLFCVDPLKVVLVASVFAIIFKSPVDNTRPRINIEKLVQTSKVYNAGSTRKYMTFWNDILKSNNKPSPAEMKKIRERRQQEIKAYGILMDLFLYAIVVFVIYGISYINRDDRSYYFKENIENALYYSYNNEKRFENVNGREYWTQWMNETFIPTFYPESEYNGNALHPSDTFLFGDLASARIGPARLRQVRMLREECSDSRLTWPYPCLHSYSEYDEDENAYCLQWKPFNASVCDTAAFKAVYFTGNAWKYTKASDIWGVSLAGEYGVYGGGGYLLQFSENSVNARRLLNELMTYDWIDRGTRAVFVEFTVYTANANLFLYVQFLTEFTELGGAFTWRTIQAFRPITSIGAMGAFSIVCYAIFIVYLIFTSVKTVLKIRKLKCKGFVSDAWNIVDLICTFLSYSLIIMFAFRMSYANTAMEKFYNELVKAQSDRQFINFQHIVIWDDTFNICLAILVFILTLRILKILGYNKKFTEVASVISNAATELIGFGLVFGIIYTSYISLGYLLFGPLLVEYKSLFDTWGTLTNALIGKNTFDKMVAVEPQWAQFYYFTYVFCVLMTLATMFAAILNKSIEEVKIQLHNEPETVGLVDVLFKSVKKMTGIVWKTKKSPDVTTRHKFVPIPGKTKIDVLNVLRLMREIFGEITPVQVMEKENALDKVEKLRNELRISRSTSCESISGSTSDRDSPKLRHRFNGKPTQTATNYKYI